MKKIVNNILKNAALTFGAALIFSIAAFAQVNPATFPTEGTSSLSATVSPSVQLSSYSSPAVTGAMPGTGATATGVASGNAINNTLNFGEVSTNNTTAAPFVSIQIGGMIRSNASYTVRARRSGTLTDGVGNSGEFKTGDIGFAIHTINAGSPPLSYPGAQAGAIAGATSLGFYNTNLLSTPLVNSQPQWSKSLNNIGTTATPIMNGTRVSNGGDNSIYQNRLTFLMTFAVKPQYYGVSASNTAITPSETLTFDIVPNP
jgi:hypothetical protein